MTRGRLRTTNHDALPDWEMPSRLHRGTSDRLAANRASFEARDDQG